MESARFELYRHKRSVSTVWALKYTCNKECNELVQQKFQEHFVGADIKSYNENYISILPNITGGAINPIYPDNDHYIIIAEREVKLYDEKTLNHCYDKIEPEEKDFNLFIKKLEALRSKTAKLKRLSNQIDSLLVDIAKEAGEISTDNIRWLQEEGIYSLWKVNELANMAADADGPINDRAERSIEHFLKFFEEVKYKRNAIFKNLIEQGTVDETVE